MRIISKFKDYYDHVQAYGVDDDVCYIRNTQTFLNSDRPYRNGWCRVNIIDEYGTPSVIEPYDMEFPIGSHDSDMIDIHFCGKLYHAIKVNQTTDSRGGIVPEQIFYNADKYKEYFEAIGYYRYHLNYRLSLLSSNGQTNTNMNTKLGHPVIMVKRDYQGLYNIYNPRLNAIQFQKAVDPYTTYMELDMFISGVLGKTGGEMVTISDKDKIDKHGFDQKYGFRKRKADK